MLSIQLLEALFIQMQTVSPLFSTGGHKSRVPVVGVLIEGGHQTFRTVFELLTGRNPVPVVICDGSGRAADLLAFMYHYAGPDGSVI